MQGNGKPNFISLILVVAAVGVFAAPGQAQSAHADEAEFGPIVRAYLQYLDTEQNVVDDRVSRREVSPAYYRRNLNRINALRVIAIRIARETNNDYLPELEAETIGELKTIFEHPPSVSTLKIGQVLNNTYKYLGSVNTRETFYMFARLDPYEQADRMKKDIEPQAAGPSDSIRVDAGEQTPEIRPRRAKSP